MKPASFVIACALALGGCETANNWSANNSTVNATTPDPGLQKFSADWEACQKENPPDKIDPATGESFARKCMRAKGYNEVKRN